MRAARGGGVLIVAAVLSAVCLGPPPRSDAAPAVRTAHLVVDVRARLAGVPLSYGYDIKEPREARALTPNRAMELFNKDNGAFAPNRFQILRVPIDALHVSPGDLSSPSVMRSYERTYGSDGPSVQAGDGVVAAVENVMDQDEYLQVYASLLRQGKRTFAPWMQGPGFTGKYAGVLAAYLEYMGDQGIVVRDLGVLCEQDAQTFAAESGEPVGNGEATFEQRYKTIIRTVRADLARYNASPTSTTKIVMPRIVGPDFTHPGQYPSGHAHPAPGGSASDFVSHVASTSSTITYASTHFYSGRLALDAPGLRTFSATAKNLARPVPVWDDEFHWTQIDAAERGQHTSLPADEIARLGLFGAFDNIDDGVSSITWWSFNPCAYYCPASGIEEASMQLVDTTDNATELPKPDDGDGTGVTTGHLVTRAFQQLEHFLGRNTTEVEDSVWVINDKTEKGKPVGYTNTRIAIHGGSLEPDYRPNCTLWIPTGAHTLTTKFFTGRQLGNTIVISRALPPNAILLVQFPVPAQTARARASQGAS